MSFSTKTDNLVKDLIQAEYNNACDNFGGTYHSLHEGYAVLLEEVEEVKEQIIILCKIGVPKLWESVKTDLYESHKTGGSDCVKLHVESMLDNTQNTMKELAQVGAVLLKIKNTIGGVEE